MNSENEIGVLWQHTFYLVLPYATDSTEKSRALGATKCNIQFVDSGRV